MIYLDNAATTYPNAEAFEKAQKIAFEQFYNPSARYGGGFAASSELKKAREILLNLIADSSFEVIFTSCGTESDNHAIFSAAKRGNAVTTAGEHSAVERSFVELKNRGVEPRFAPLNPDGSVKIDKLLDLVDEKTSLVSVVHVNNETGAINDLASIAKAVKAKNPRCIVHSDGVQAFGKIAFRLPKEVDLYSVSAHKLGGLKGTGALFKRKTLALSPLLHGGGQEGTLRSGTENLLGILDFAFAAEIMFRTLNIDNERIANFRETLWNALDKSLFERISPENGSPYILTVAAKGTRGEVIQRILWDKGIAVGTGSACSSKKPHSRILEACGYGNAVLDGVLRVSFSPENMQEEIEHTAACMNGAVSEYRKKV